MVRLQESILAVLVVCCGAARIDGQVKTDLVNAQGATAPCVGVGPIGGPAAKKCATLFEQAGFLTSDEVGYSGLSIGKDGSNDGTVSAVDSNSPATSAGFKTGDAIVTVNGKPVALTPGTIASKALFGRRGDTVHVTVKRDGKERTVSLTRTPQDPPAGPKASGFMTVVKPMINWQNQFAPCIGIGPAAMAGIELCYSKFKPYGFIKADELGSTGLQFDLTNTNRALVATVTPDSAAAKAGIERGDEIVAVEGQPLTASKGESAAEMLFGKAGDRFEVTVQRGEADPKIELVLGAKPK